MFERRMSRHAVAFVIAFVATVDAVHAQQPTTASMPQLHHVGLNSVDPETAIDWYPEIWPAARRTEVAGFPGVQARLRLASVTIIEGPYTFGDSRAIMIEDPDGLAIALIERRSGATDRRP
jgi:hypothetical protein